MVIKHFRALLLHEPARHGLPAADCFPSGPHRTVSALLLALLAAHGHKVVYVPGRTVNRMVGAYRGEAKTDARDAYVIAETARHRRDFTTIGVPAQLVSDLALTAHRADLMADWVRMINRMHDVLTGVFPDYADRKGALVLLTGFQTPGRHSPPRPDPPDGLARQTRGIQPRRHCGGSPRSSRSPAHRTVGGGRRSPDHRRSGPAAPRPVRPRQRGLVQDKDRRLDEDHAGE